MISVELIIIITQICMAPSGSVKDIEVSDKCNKSIIKCVESHKANLTNRKFSDCIVKYELEK